MFLVADAHTGRRLAMKVVAKNGLRLREYPAVFAEQAVARALSEDPAKPGGRGGKRDGRGGGEGEGRTGWFVPLLGSFEDTDNFYFVMVRVLSRNRQFGGVG